MRFLRLLLVFSFFCVCASAYAQVEVDYNRPKEYSIAGVKVEGNTYFDQRQIAAQSGLFLGRKVTIPGDDIASAIKRLLVKGYFEDVAIYADSLNARKDSVYLRIALKERPRMSGWDYTGIKSGDKKELNERIGFRRGGDFSEYTRTTAEGIIKRYYNEKGFLLCSVNSEIKKDTMVRNAIRVYFHIDKGPKVRIKDINFKGVEDISEYKLAKSMKKTKSNKFYNFFSSKKFNEKEYPEDKKNLISTLNEAGYRDARIVKDSVYMVDVVSKNGKVKKKINIDIEIEEGKKYYFGDITWTGNALYPSEALDQILGIQKGDVYDVVSMNKRLFGGGKQGDYDVSKLYRDKGYLFFQISPVETNIQNDSVDVEIRISEGKQATLNNIIINGNDLTNEKVVRRQIVTRPGYLFSQSDFERSIREIASLGQFDAEAIMGENGYSIMPNQRDNTVDLIYNVTEKPSSQLELSGGWGGNTFVATVGVSFNNFSSRRMFEEDAWRPVPLGDAQNLAFRFQTNGTYYTALTASFTEPWLFGKKPTSLNLSAYYTRQTNSYLALNILSHDRQMEVFGVSGSIGTRLKWPDNYFVLYNGMNWQTYKLTNWYSGYFIFDNGYSNNISYSLNLMRNSTDQQIYPRQGSEFNFSLSLTPPFSLFRKYDYDASGKRVSVDSYKDVNYDNWTSQKRYRWIEYHKWKFSATQYIKLYGDLVLMTRAQFGYLGFYNRKWGYSPFEGFLLGGDGMSGYNTYGSEVIALRGYENYSLTPYTATSYKSEGGGAYAGNVYDKFTLELRYPVIMQPSSTIYLLAFLEGGNCWSDIRQFNPFQIYRSAGVGVRVFLPMVGLIGVDWGYGFDGRAKNLGGSQFHFVIGQQF